MNQSTDYLQKKQTLQDKMDVTRAFKLAKQDEQVRNANQKWLSSIQMITNISK